MKKLLIVLIILTVTTTFISAESAKDIIGKMEEVMDFDTLSFSATIKNSDKMGSTSQKFDAIQNSNGDTLLTVTSGMDKGQKILRLSNEIYIYIISIQIKFYIIHTLETEQHNNIKKKHCLCF